METISIGGYTTIHQAVTPEQCTGWMNRMLARRDAWVERLGFHTFGRAWYTEIATGHLPTYHAQAWQANTLVATLPGYTAAMIAAAKALTVPGSPADFSVRARRENLGEYWCDSGLHILGERSQGGGVAHIDLEGLAPYPPVMFDRGAAAFSAVLCVAAPARGGDLLIWPEKRYFADTAENLPVRKADAVRLSCRAGDLLIFDSFLPHMIDAYEVDDEAPWRVTGVIHFLLREEPYPHWEYWF